MHKIAAAAKHKMRYKISINCYEEGCIYKSLLMNIFMHQNGNLSGHRHYRSYIQTTNQYLNRPKCTKLNVMMIDLNDKYIPNGGEWLRMEKPGNILTST